MVRIDVPWQLLGRLPWRRAWDWTWARVRRSDLAVGYLMALLVVFAWVHWRSEPASHAIVVHSSTNLVNLRQHPWVVLVVSAFVLAKAVDLVLLPILVLLFAAVQDWLGRAATLVTAAVGHVGATLFVSTALLAGIWHGRIHASVSRVPDVGVSYELACLSGLLLARVPARWRWPYLALLLVVLVVPFPFQPSFTNLGHATALVLGLGLSLLPMRAAQRAAAGS